MQGTTVWRSAVVARPRRGGCGGCGWLGRGMPGANTVRRSAVAARPRRGGCGVCGWLGRGTPGANTAVRRGTSGPMPQTGARRAAAPGWGAGRSATSGTPGAAKRVLHDEVIHGTPSPARTGRSKLSERNRSSASTRFDPACLPTPGTDVWLDYPRDGPSECCGLLSGSEVGGR